MQALRTLGAGFPVCAPTAGVDAGEVAAAAVQGEQRCGQDPRGYEERAALAHAPLSREGASEPGPPIIGAVPQRS